jgi:steroid delta-isomerase-like uncharacterized protein
MMPLERADLKGVDAVASKNVQTLKDLIKAFGKKALDAIAALYSEQSVLVAHARGETVKGRAAIKENWQMWATAFPDGQIEEAHFVDGGDVTAMYFVGRGTNTGATGPMPATGKRIALPYCAIFAFDAKGKIVEEDDYWDQLGFLVQLGVMEPPAM